MILSFILIYIAGFCKAVMDTLQFHFQNSVFYNSIHKFWNPKISWLNKYSSISPLTRKKFFKIIPVPVMLTDAWHLFQSIYLTTLFLGILLCPPVSVCDIYVVRVLISFIVLRLIFGLSFTLFYNKILKK